ncbi:MAG: hypothetical protein WAV38_32750 [Xanthobacteraceae bacterium]
MMARVLILGANGQLARNTTRVLLGDPALTLTLYLRRANRLKNPAHERVAKRRDRSRCGAPWWQCSSSLLRRLIRAL